jgi:hypothetical protein
VLGPAIKGVTIRGGEERLARVLNPDVGGAEDRILGVVNSAKSSVQVQSSQVKAFSHHSSRPTMGVIA